MKLLKYGLPLVALGIMASCSNDNIDAPVNPTPAPVEGDGMYMTLNISLPVTKGTKALESYEEGIASEYAVKTMDLYIFKLASDAEGTPEEAATFYKYIPVGFSTPAESSDYIDVQGTYQATFQFQDDNLKNNGNGGAETIDGSKYYGLLILNRGTAIPEPNATYNTFNKWNDQVLGVTGESTTPPTDIMIPTINGTKYFAMANAPLVVDGKAATLVEIKPENFTISPILADGDYPAAEFYVQRGVAKVYVKEGIDEVENEAKEGSDDIVSIDAWALDVTNQITFPVQNVTDFDSWTGDHFTTVSQQPGSEAVTHIWWAVDPNYTGDETTEADRTAFSFLSKATTKTVSLTVGYNEDDETSWAYCLENTMNYDQMIKNQTTRVVFAATYKVDGKELGNDEAGFLVFNDVAMVVKTADLKTATQASTKAIKLSDLISAGTDDETIENYRNTLKMANYEQEVAYYADGKTYYVAYIRHFDEYETPLPEGTTDYDLSQLKNSDLTSWSAQLGRYGVLRNNAYEIDVVAVIGYGSPEFPDDPDEPDDKIPENKYNAIVNINVLNWAKRSFEYRPR